MVPLPPGPAPFYQFLAKIVEKWLKSNTGPIVVGISAPQGSGKTFAVTKAKEYLSQLYPKVSVVAMSMDDVYLTHEEQQKLTHSTHNRLLQGRGLPGTHDISLLNEVLSSVKSKGHSEQDKEHDSVAIPQYDKSAFNGEGDREPKQKWPVYERIDVLLFEGWFNGYLPLGDAEVRTVYEQMSDTSATKQHTADDVVQVNEFLKQYVGVWDRFDYFVNFETDNIMNVFKWRVEQEHDLIARKGTGMTDEQVKAFISRYMVMYEVYYRKLCEQRRDRWLSVVIDENRAVKGSRGG